MLRSVTLGLAMSVLLAACALVEPPLPPVAPGTFTVQGEVRNMSAKPVPLAVFRGAAVLPGAVEPVSAPAHTATNVTFYVPLTEDASILVDSRLTITSSEVRPNNLGQGCTFLIDVAADEGITYGCDFLTDP